MPPKRGKRAAAAASSSSSSSNFLAGVCACFNGRLPSSQALLTSQIESAGGSTSATVSGATILISAEGAAALGAAKVAEALSAGIPIIKHDWLAQSIAAGKVEPYSPYVIASSGTTTTAAAAAAAPAAAPRGGGRGKRGAATGKRAASPAPDPSSPAPKRGKAGKRAAASTSSAPPDSDSSSDSDSDVATKKVVVKGSVPVDPLSGLAGTAHVLQTPSGEVFDCMLNQVNIRNNNNKFYAIQVLEKDTGGTWWCTTRWGRVGELGAFKMFGPFNSKDRAIANFHSKFKAKTKNAWADRANFVKYSGKYDLVETDWSSGDQDTGGASSSSHSVSSSMPKREPSHLSEPLQKLMMLITNKDMMDRSMREFDINPKKCPLGKLSANQVKKGFEIIRDIHNIVSSPVFSSSQRRELEDLSSEFYTVIPHEFPRHVRPPVISDAASVKRKIRMLEMLDEMQVAASILKDVDQSTANELDGAYKQMHCDLEPLDHNSSEFRMLEEYVANTHAQTHRGYGLEVLDVFKVEKEGQQETFKKWEDLQNRRLLWHGSRLANWMGILSQGLRIAPPEAPASGYMFGKGVYFADAVSKSANYCRASRSDPVALLLLCDVALGNMYECKRAEYMEKPRPGYHSTWGQGGTTPDERAYRTLPGGTVVPMGQMKQKNIGSSLLYNEFIIYDTTQQKMRYLLKLKFHFH